ncbi:hypothetical protein pdam_00020463 [Pocillopora damicornis]|uniref:NTR domain-containing protein n=1 Tax=Pocillopora damicornis TaxID=46731 RepID=A0A3M6V0T4_POCDA|nr:hypothetical protein pdam_00020463 [Pocillopora damicornis]
MVSILSYATLILCTVALSESCSCAKTTHMAILCRDDFAFLTRSFCLHLTAIRAKVTQVTDLGSRKIYTLDIKNIFKEGAQFYKVTPTMATIQGPVRSGTAWTRTDGCGIDLELGNVYLLTGKIEKSEDADLHITRCGWNVEFQNVSKNKQKTLENYYKKEQEKC